MNRSLTRAAPIMVYGLDTPFTAFGALQHHNFMFDYTSQVGDASLKFFKHPIYVLTHAIVRRTENQWGKHTFSVLPEESDFFKQVETSIMSTLDRVIGMAEPTLYVDKLRLKSMMYENLVQLRCNKAVGQNKDGNMVDDAAAVLISGTKVLMTVEVYGVYHSPQGKGVLPRIQSFRVVETF